MTRARIAADQCVSDRGEASSSSGADGGCRCLHWSTTLRGGGGRHDHCAAHRVGVRSGRRFGVARRTTSTGRSPGIRLWRWLRRRLSGRRRAVIPGRRPVAVGRFRDGVASRPACRRRGPSFGVAVQASQEPVSTRHRTRRPTGRGRVVTRSLARRSLNRLLGSAHRLSFKSASAWRRHLPAVAHTPRALAHRWCGDRGHPRRPV